MLSIFFSYKVPVVLDSLMSAPLTLLAARSEEYRELVMSVDGRKYGSSPVPYSELCSPDLPFYSV